MFRFISLGGDIRFTSQVNGLQRLPARHVFDTVECPIQSTIRLIENRFSDLLIPDNLQPVYQDGVLTCVVDVSYRLQMPHDFAEFSAEEIAAVQRRYALRARWFDELFDPGERPVYFVRRWHAMDGPEDEGLAEQLFELVRSRRPDIRFLYLHNDPGRPKRINGAYRSACLETSDEPVRGDEAEAVRAMLHGFAVEHNPARDYGFMLPSRPRPRFAVAVPA